MLDLALSLILQTAAPVTTVSVEVVRKPAELQRGLQGHKPLIEGKGMLFVLPGAEVSRFWMRDMTFDIDILFLRADGTVANVVVRAPACRQVECPVYSSRGPVTHVLEVPAGWSERHHVDAGTPLKIDLAGQRVSLAAPVE
jgi:uncharacterized membrane protein (UPF0127 family)